MKLPLIIITALSLMAVAAGFALGSKTTPAPREPSLQVATVLPTARPLKAFTLIDNEGKPFTQENLRGQWTWLFFGFTRCTSICPTTLAVMNQVYSHLQEEHVSPLPQVVFVSVDPEQDTVKHIDSFVHGFNPHFKGVTGSKSELDQLAQEMSVLYMKVDAPEKGPHGYTIDHSGTLMLLNPEGKLFAFFSAPQVAEHLVNDYREIIR